MTGERCPSSWSLESYLAHESHDEEVARHVAVCRRCQNELAAMRRQGESYLASPEAERVRRLLDEQRPIAKPRLSRWGVPLLLAAVSLGSFLLVLSPDEQPPDGGIDLVSKGASTLLLWRDAPDGAVPLQDEWVLAGARLQCGLSVAATGFVAGFVRDGERFVRIFPEGAQALPISSEGSRPLGPSFQVDGDTRRLTVLVYFSERSFSVAALEQALRRGDVAGLSGTLLQRKVEVRQR